MAGKVRGDEDKLLEEIWAFLSGKPLPTNVHLKFSGADARNVLTGGGSGNIPLMAMALLLAFRGIAAATIFWERFFEVSRKAWMGRELMSRIYGLWHLIAVLLVYAHGPRHLQLEAARWVRTFFALLYRTSDSSGRTIFGGMRSAGHDIGHDAYEWVLAVAHGGNARRWERGWKGKLEFSILNRFKPALAELGIEWRREGRDLALDFFAPMSPVWLYQTVAGAAFFHSRNLNGNTGAWMGGTLELDEEAELLPENGGHRKRQTPDHPTVVRDGDLLRYTGSSIYPDAVATLPPGLPTFLRTWGADVEPPPPPPPPEEEPEPEEEPPAEDEPSLLERFFLWLQSLRGRR